MGIKVGLIFLSLGLLLVNVPLGIFITYMILTTINAPVWLLVLFWVNAGLSILISILGFVTRIIEDVFEELQK